MGKSQGLHTTSSIFEVRFEAVVSVRTFDSCEPASKYGALHR